MLPSPADVAAGGDGGAPGTGAPRGNRNARRHGRYTAQSCEIRALGRLQNRVADLAKAQLAVMNARAREDPHRVAAADERVAVCKQRVRRAARALDRVLAVRGDEDGRGLVEGAMRLTDTL